MLYKDLSLPAQTAYAQLAEATLAADLSRSIADLKGDFCRKTVKGKTYWYFQHPGLDGAYRQMYVGPDSPEVAKLIAHRDGATETAAAIGRLAKAAIVHGCSALLPAHFKVIRRLADHGFFRAGGVLIGSHAFQVYGNVLGVRWGGNDRTEDVDFAHAGKKVSIALPASIEAQTRTAIESLEMGFVPITGASGKPTGSFTIPKSPEFKLDFLTPMTRDGDTAYEHPQLHVPLTPMKFMEFSLEQVEQAVMFSAEGAVTVNIPSPSRYALHKLIVYGERQGSFRAKAPKDLAQSAAILYCLKNRRPWEVEEALHDLFSRGSGWRSRANEGIKALDRVYPDTGLSQWLGEKIAGHSAN